MESAFLYLSNRFVQYENYLILILITFFISFFLTPITGVIAHKINALDMPAKKRDKTDRTRFRRIHDKIMPNLGGIAIIISIVIGILLSIQMGFFTNESRKIIQIFIGFAIIVFLGVSDSIKDVTPKKQIFFQILAALLVTTAGIKINSIDFLNIFIKFDAINFDINIGNVTLYITPIADLLTIVWIVGLMNAINWVSGIDGLAASMTFMAGITMMFIGVELQVIFAAVLSAVLVGSVFGFLPFNLPPAKTYSGTSGDLLQGYVLAIVSIMLGGKVSVALIVLVVPILDAFWVLAGRLKRHRNDINSISDLLQISDNTHLHHRLLKIGFSKKQVLIFELLIVFIFCVAAYYLAGFNHITLFVLVSIVVVLFFFTIISFLTKNKSRSEVDDILAEKLKAEKNKKKSKIIEETPEEKYAY